MATSRVSAALFLFALSLAVANHGEYPERPCARAALESAAETCYGAVVDSSFQGQDEKLSSKEILCCSKTGLIQCLDVASRHLGCSERDSLEMFFNTISQAFRSEVLTAHAKCTDKHESKCHNLLSFFRDAEMSITSNTGSFERIPKSLAPNSTNATEVPSVSGVEDIRNGSMRSLSLENNTYSLDATNHTLPDVRNGSMRSLFLENTSYPLDIANDTLDTRNGSSRSLTLENTTYSLDSANDTLADTRNGSSRSFSFNTIYPLNVSSNTLDTRNDSSRSLSLENASYPLDGSNTTLLNSTVLDVNRNNSMRSLPDGDQRNSSLSDNATSLNVSSSNDTRDTRSFWADVVNYFHPNNLSANSTSLNDSASAVNETRDQRAFVQWQDKRHLEILIFDDNGTIAAFKMNTQQVGEVDLSKLDHNVPGFGQLNSHTQSEPLGQPYLLQWLDGSEVALWKIVNRDSNETVLVLAAVTRKNGSLYLDDLRHFPSSSDGSNLLSHEWVDHMREFLKRAMNSSVSHSTGFELAGSNDTRDERSFWTDIVNFFHPNSTEDSVPQNGTAQASPSTLSNITVGRNDSARSYAISEPNNVTDRISSSNTSVSVSTELQERNFSAPDLNNATLQNSTDLVNQTAGNRSDNVRYLAFPTDATYDSANATSAPSVNWFISNKSTDVANSSSSVGNGTIGENLFLNASLANQTVDTALNASGNNLTETSESNSSTLLPEEFLTYGNYSVQWEPKLESTSENPADGFSQSPNVRNSRTFNDSSITDGVSNATSFFADLFPGANETRVSRTFGNLSMPIGNGTFQDFADSASNLFIGSRNSRDYGSSSFNFSRISTSDQQDAADGFNSSSRNTRNYASVPSNLTDNTSSAVRNATEDSNSTLGTFVLENGSGVAENRSHHTEKRDVTTAKWNSTFCSDSNPACNETANSQSEGSREGRQSDPSEPSLFDRFIAGFVQTTTTTGAPTIEPAFSLVSSTQGVQSTTAPPAISSVVPTSESSVVSFFRNFELQVNATTSTTMDPRMVVSAVDDMEHAVGVQPQHEVAGPVETTSPKSPTTTAPGQTGTAVRALTPHSAFSVMALLFLFASFL